MTLDYPTARDWLKDRTFRPLGHDWKGTSNGRWTGASCTRCGISDGYPDTDAASTKLCPGKPA